MALFDAYIMVDWSAAAKPALGPNSIWIGALTKDARLKLQFKAENIDTRLKARAYLEDMIGKLTKRGDKVLLGFDFAIGYPAGTAKALGLDTSKLGAWAAMQAHLATRYKDKPDNNSRPRFAIAAGLNYTISKGPFPFWGAPPTDRATTLTSTKTPFTPDKPLAEYRLVEQHLRSVPGASPKSCWQLYGAGSVGSQSLTGIPHVHALRQSLPNARIWPFELGEGGPLTAEMLEGVDVLIAEIYPSLVKPQPEKGEVPDEAQVRQIARHYADLDEKNRLGAAFSTGKTRSEDEIARIIGEEGWILGV